MIVTNSSVSSIEELNVAIQSYNPFSSAAIDNVQSVWGKGFPDLATLNAHASQKVLEVIKQVKTSPESKDKVATLVVTADVGSGKTQLISRLRRRLIGDGSALFVYANAAKYGNLDLLRYQFLQSLVENLARVGSQGVTQWQEVAAALANASNATGQKTPAATLVKNFDRAYAKALQNNHNLIKKLSVQILKSKPDADPYILRAILWTLSEMYAPYAVEWLAGNELDQETADSMGLPTNASKTAQDEEAEALGNLQQILRLISDHKPVLICFDELEGQGVLSTDGFTKTQVIARLVKDLYDNLEQSGIGKGVVILTVMFESTWRGQIKGTGSGMDMGGGVLDRMSTATQGNPISLERLNSQSMVDLVALWLREQLYEPRNLTPHNSTYPFREDELREVGKGKLTVREALNWCAENFDIGGNDDNPEEKFEKALKAANEADMGDYLEDNDLIANALYFGFENLIGEVLEGETETGQKLKQVTLDKIETVGDWVRFKVSGKESNKSFTIGVSVIQQKNAASVGAGLKRLTDYKRFGLTRGCLVRSKNKKINKNSQAYKRLEKLTSKNMGGEWAYLEAEQIRPLINLYTVYQNGESYQLTQEQVVEFSKPQILENPLLREILSDPSGEIDEETIEDEEMFGALFEESSTDDTADNEELDDLFAVEDNE
ncbi:P-loop NTPase fold protein [Coleofasciculus sp. LEGE 07081]|uniref:P-loop NTPase fold protein n=1 Tax=Coleofasciculus sp. LEGE 07081 TaxID=2777967 RepID=UPI001D13BA64|nr:P-loop NTPase fold protein [Coleofasciculus sp. LEGE 07081]